MKKLDGSLMAYLNNSTKAAAQNMSSNTIKMIDVADLVPNTGNFYGIRDIEQLAHSMALSNTVEPLMVAKRNGEEKYDIISGERRYRAVSLRLERGEITDSKVPCIVHEPFADDGKITAKMKEDIAIICANSYREKNALEKLQEVDVLEPIARIYYDELLANNEHEGMSFRAYFAEKFLGISSSSLQRLITLRKLTPEAKTALVNGDVSDTLAAYIARKSPEEQLEYLRQLQAGEVSGTVRELQEKDKAEAEAGDESMDSGSEAEEVQESFPSEDVEEIEEPESTGEDNLSAAINDDNDDSDTETEIPAQPQSIEGKLEQEGQTKLFDTSIPENITPENAENEANNWVEEGLRQMETLAADKAKSARESGDSRMAAQWDVRLAAVRLVIETIK